MKDNHYSVGELATMTRLSVRTLQYYDQIGLLPASRNPESGRRYYSATDLIRLEQILFYRLLGFPLDKIQENLTNSQIPGEMRDLFVEQENTLLRKMESLHTSFAAIDASIKVLASGSPPPFEVILQFLHLLPGDDVFDWAPSLLDAEQQSILSRHFKNLEMARSFYHTLKSLLIDALVLYHAHVPATHPQARELAERWQDMMRSITVENPEVLEQLTRIGGKSEFGSANNQPLMRDAFQYIQEAMGGAPSATRD